jgi:hypothetical protein
MGDTIEFHTATFRDSLPPKTLEDSVRLTCAYGGAHDFDFQYDVDEDFSSLASWTVEAGGGAQVSDGTLELWGGGGAQMYLVTHDTEVAPSLTATFDWVGESSGGFFYKKASGDLRCFFLGWDSTYFGAGYTNAAGVNTNITRVPHGGVTSPAKLQVQARYSLDSVDDERKWVEGLLYLDGRAVCGFAKDIGSTALDWDGDGVGFLVYGGNICNVDNLKISSLHRQVEWTTIDMGTPAATGMSRAIGTTRIKYMCRYDNTVRVWRPGNKSLDWTPPSANVKKTGARLNYIRPTHVRVQAAIHEADSFDGPVGEDLMHRFAVHNDPNIMTEGEAYTEGYRVMHDYKEAAKIQRFVLPPNYLLEPYDRIQVDGVDWRVMQIQYSLVMQGGEPMAQSIIECQRYEELTLP